MTSVTEKALRDTIVTGALANILNLTTRREFKGACDFSLRAFLCDFLVVLVVSNLLHFVVVSIKPTLFVCCYYFSVISEVIVIVVSLGNIGQFRLLFSFLTGLMKTLIPKKLVWN